jgi:hypothetical protein
VAATLAATCAYAAWLLPGSGVGVISWLPELVAVLGLAAVIVLLMPARIAARPAALALGAVAACLVPVVASIAIVAKGLGPFDTPFESTASSRIARALGGVAKQTAALLAPLEAARHGQGDLMATQTSAVAAPFIYDSGQEVLPIGGFSGATPEPTLAALESMIAKGDFHTVVQSPTVTDPRLVWVAGHCLTLSSGAGRPGAVGLRFAVYYCGRPQLP